MQRMWSTYFLSPPSTNESGVPSERHGRSMEHANPHSRASSSESHDANSTNSQAASTQHILMDRERARLMPSTAAPTTNPSTSVLERPVAPFMLGGGGGGGSGSSGGGSHSGTASPSPLQTPAIEHKLVSESSSMSLSVNYLPHKFSATMINPGARRRKANGGGKKVEQAQVPKMGGGVDAFRSGLARMPEQGDDEYDGVDLKNGLFGGREGTKRRMSWNRFKWILFVANICLSAYSLVALVICLLTWFDVWDKADIVRVGNRSELVISTLAASMGMFTSLLGWAGILLNNRSFLAVYTLLLWITFVFVVAPGYLTYKRHTFNLEGKINAQWSRDLGSDGRLRIQNQLLCCGYFSPFIEATVSQTCYARSILPGCKLHYLQFERMVLRRWYTAVFSIAPFHILIMVAGLLCSNHVTYRFGKGMMPKAYRLSMNSMAIIMDNYASQLAERYGDGVASEVLARSRSNLQLDALPSIGYSQSKGPAKGTD